MRGAGTHPRLLWPSNSQEAQLELERVGARGPWPGTLGAPPRSGREGEFADIPVTLVVPGPLPKGLLDASPPVEISLTGAPGKGVLVTGKVDSLIEWLGAFGDTLEEERRAVSFGCGLEAPACWRFGGFTLPLTGGTRLMAVVNVTPDSFYAGSRARSEDEVAAALDRAAEGGADVVDIGGESTRPGAEPLTAAEEIERVVGAIEMAVRRTELPVSVDTTKVEVARAALDAGAVIVNDISGGTDDPGLLTLVAERGAGLVLMHRRGIPATMQEDPGYDNLMSEIYSYLAGRTREALNRGVEADRIVVDPGLGFGKRRQHNFELYRRVTEFHAMGYPLLAGPSRKRHTSGPSDRPAEERLMATAAACAILAYQGVQILRVHDVEEMRRALDTVDEIRGAIIEDRVS